MSEESVKKDDIVDFEKVNYGLLKKLGVLDIKESKLIKYEHFMSLNISLRHNDDVMCVVILAHNIIQDGVVMANPGMEIVLYKRLEIAKPLTYLNLKNIEKVYENNYINCNYELKKQLDNFLNTWLVNLLKQRII